MKAEFKMDGTLVISAETGVEAYALRKWVEDEDRESMYDFSLRSDDDLYEGLRGETAPLMEDNLPERGELP